MWLGAQPVLAQGDMPKLSGLCATTKPRHAERQQSKENKPTMSQKWRTWRWGQSMLLKHFTTTLLLQSEIAAAASECVQQKTVCFIYFFLILHLKQIQVKNSTISYSLFLLCKKESDLFSSQNVTKLKNIRIWRVSHKQTFITGWRKQKEYTDRSAGLDAQP